MNFWVVFLDEVLVHVCEFYFYLKGMTNYVMEC